MKKMVQAALEKLGFEVRRTPSRPADPETVYLNGGKIPWTHGYSQAKERFIREAIANGDILELFRNAEKLPEQWGVGLDERCVEYPWLLSNLNNGPEHLLDAGSILNSQFILDHPIFREKKLHILTLAPEGSCFWHKCVSYLYDDLRDIPIRNDYYDTIVCLSTLEHIGCDNQRYSPGEIHREQRLEDFLLVMRELRRVVKPGGRLFLTVPFGLYQYFGEFQQFDRRMLGRAVDAFGKTTKASCDVLSLFR